MKNRELERKYIVSRNGSYDTLKGLITYFQTDVLKDKLEPKGFFTGKDIDYFWPTKNGDFLRLRATNNQLTLKRTDRGSIQNRLEINAVVETNKMLELLKEERGEPSLRVEKDYIVYRMPDNAEISLYQAKNNPSVFLEVEAHSLRTLKSYCAKLAKFLELELQTESLYAIMSKRSLNKKKGR